MKVNGLSCIKLRTMGINGKGIAVRWGLKAQSMDIAQKIIEAHKLKFGSLPPLQQCSVSGSTFVNADCFDVFPFIEDKSIDAIICDLPYGTTACSWDIIIPFDKLWEQYKRIIKDKGVIVLFGSEPFSSLLRTSNLEWYKYDWIWEKNNAGNFQLCS